jgi:hypothetical protein
LNRRMGLGNGAHLDILRRDKSLAHGGLQTLEQAASSLITVLTALSLYPGGTQSKH